MIKLSDIKVHNTFHVLAHLILFLFLYYLNIFPSLSIWNLVFIIISSNLIDLDHLLARPIFEEGRCSITGKSILHKWYLILLWVLGVFIPIPHVQVFCLGVLSHILVDGLGCYLMSKEAKKERGKEEQV